MDALVVQPTASALSFILFVLDGKALAVGRLVRSCNALVVQPTASALSFILFVLTARRWSLVDS